MNKKIFTFRLAPLTMAFAFLFATFAAPHTAQAQSLTPIQNARCSNIQQFGTKVISNVRASLPGMQAAFDKTIRDMNANWEREDIITTASRQITINGFTASIDWSITLLQSANKKAGLETYKKTVTDGLSEYYVNVDAAKAQYREDLMALVRDHHAKLLKLANNYISDLTKELDAAKKTCANIGAGLAFTFKLLGAGAGYIANVVAQDLDTIGQALKIIHTYWSSIVHEFGILVNDVLTAILRVLNVLIRG